MADTKTLAELLGVDAGAHAAETAKKKRTIKKGSAQSKLLKILKAANRQYTYAEIAPLVPRGRGGGIGVEVQSLKTEVSKLKGALTDMGFNEQQILSIMPKDYNEQGRGRRAGESESVDDIAALLDADSDDVADMLADADNDDADEDVAL